MAAVGRIAGVSQVTVSRALSDPSKVSPDTLRRIHDAIEVTGFVPNALAGALASRKSKLISALVPALTNIVYSSMLKSFSARLRSEGYEILLSETGFDPADEERVIATHLSRRPDAVLLTGIHHSAHARKMLLGAEIPVVEVWDITDTPIDLCVGFSHAATARAVAEYAVERGYMKAGTISAGDERAHRRKTAFVDRFEELTGSSVAQYDHGSLASLGQGRKGLAHLLDNYDLRNGLIFCSSDLLAQGVLIEAHARGLTVPDDIAVIGFGDQEAAAELEPSLTSVRVDRTTLGLTAAEAVLARLEGKDAPPRSTDIGFEIITRDSA
ncbi:LacI family DNA-binding transcriptional regulator (plasmid) [Qingshengfaniella alkalisoli]|uniref:LacI family DNA-binding transcriptional regulator n=2 Tax=Qingshengfaniella alkalisoli TaxID=2599296 RepID=A0A5B8J2L2_9RHOB|nr:LacI family DNA-binding transcriptional regulator [Qingshengfaniella alkalisoli]